MAKQGGIKNTWWANLGLAIVCFAITYGFASWSIDSGNMFAYLLTIIFLILGINRLVAAIRHTRAH